MTSEATDINAEIEKKRKEVKSLIRKNPKLSKNMIVIYTMMLGGWYSSKTLKEKILKEFNLDYSEAYIGQVIIKLKTSLFKYLILSRNGKKKRSFEHYLPNSSILLAPLDNKLKKALLTLFKKNDIPEEMFREVSENFPKILTVIEEKESLKKENKDYFAPILRITNKTKKAPKIPEKVSDIMLLKELVVSIAKSILSYLDKKEKLSK